MNKKDMAIIVQAIDMLTTVMSGQGVLNELDKARLNRIVETEFGMTTGELTHEQAIEVVEYIVELANNLKEMLFSDGGEVH